MMEELILKRVKDYLDYFDNSYVQKHSFDFFIHHRLNKIIEEEPTIEIPLGEDRFYCVKFGQVFVDKPYIIDENRQVRYITPNEARTRDLTYSSAISVNIRTSTVINGVESNQKDFFKVLIARIPMMIGTSKCNLFDMTPEQKKLAGECDYDKGGYFIVKGKERVLVSQERMNHNVVYVFEQKPSSKFQLVSEIRSMSEETGHSVLIQMKITNDKKVVLQIPYMSQEIPLGIVLRGFHVSVAEIEEMIIFHIGKKSMEEVPMLSRMIRSILRDAEMMDSHEKVLSYIAQFAVHNVSKERKLFYVNQILQNELFPHLGITSTRTQKAFFLGHMFGKLIRTYLGMRPMDDRDHINNKRVEVSGHLLSELFRTLFKRFVRAMEPQLHKRPDIMVVISRMNLITQGIKHCFSTGNWGMPKSSYIRTGVSQILSRLTYNAFMSHLRRILIPVGKEGKNTKIRQVHPSQIGFICPHETPEGHCLTGDTDILMEDGVTTVPMSDLETGEHQRKIVTVNIQNGEQQTTTYHHYFNVIPESLYEVTLVNGATIRASGLHPFLVYRRGEADAIWVQTQDLESSDRIAYTFPLKKLPKQEKPYDHTLVSKGSLLLRSRNYIKKSKDMMKITAHLYRYDVFLKHMTTTWELLPVASRIFGCLCIPLLSMSLTDPIPLAGIDQDSFYEDVKRILPWDDIEHDKNHMSLGPFSDVVLTELYRLDDWRTTVSLPLWILEGSLAVQREFVTGFFAMVGYHIIDPRSKQPLTLTLSSNGLSWDRFIALIRVIHRMLNDISPSWDLISFEERSSIELRPHACKVLDVIHTLGVRYHRQWERERCLSYLYHTTVYDGWNTWNDMVNMVRPLPTCDLLFIPLNKDGIRRIEKEMTMDFTTTSHHHSFIANGFVTHNSAGIVKNMTMSVQVTTRMDTVYLRRIIESLPGLIPVSHEMCEKLGHENSFYKIFLNGIWVGTSTDESLYHTLLMYKKQNRFPSTISISIHREEREVNMYGDEGRMIRPFWDASNLPTRQDLENKDIMTLIEEKKIVFLDSYEIENKVIAMTLDELTKESFYDYCEIHPSLLMGLCVGLIPYAEHTQAPRITYHASMGKQAIGYYASTHSYRMDTISHLLCYPERPLIRTHYGDYTGCDNLATGSNIIVAICMYTGFNQEDSVIFNQSAIDRGLFRSYSYRTMFVEERKKSTNYTETIELPSKELRTKSFNYTKLNSDGLVKVGAFVGSGDVIVGRVQVKITKSGTEEKTDTSVIIKSGEEGYVDTVISTYNPDGYKIAKIRIRTLKIPEIGDKVASRSAQKGTIGMVYRQEDMPFTTSGIVPDIIINPLCIPSRMTINQLIECLGAKSAAHKAIHRYCTPFSSHSTDIVSHLCDELHSCGFEKNGNEMMFNGFTGECFESTIFIGPTYYHRLKHLVSAKIHARNHGSLQALTRQPLEGRSRDGGLRFGEMERDCMISHGVSRFLTERLFDMSDKFSIPVCADCGVIPNSLDHCNLCDSLQVRRTPLPYACKLLFQELSAMGIKINLFPTEDI